MKSNGVYYFVAKTDSGRTEVESIEINTIIEKPEISIKDITGQSFTIVVNTNYKEGLVTNYNYYVEGIEKTGGTTEKEVTIEDLIPGTKYSNVYVEATILGKVLKSEIIEVTTKNIEVSKIILNEERKILKPNETFKLEATIEPENATNKNIIYSTEDEDIATVDVNGIITGKKEGKTTITATAADGSEVYAKCEVTVSNTLNEYSVTNYPIDIDGDGNYSNDWEVLYTSDTNIYLIASKCIPNNKVPLEKIGAVADDTKGWFQFINPEYTELSKEVKDNFYILDNLSSNYAFGGEITVMQNPENWTYFVDNQWAESAVGAPSIGLFAKSLENLTGQILTLNVKETHIDVNEYRMFYYYGLSCNDNPVLFKDNYNWYYVAGTTFDGGDNNRYVSLRAGRRVPPANNSGAPMLCGYRGYVCEYGLTGIGNYLARSRPVVRLKSNIGLKDGLLYNK